MPIIKSIKTKQGNKMGIAKKTKTIRLNMDLPQHVHDYLASLHGTKKYNAEAILMAAARKNGFRADDK